MRLIVFFWLLVACFCMTVLSQVGDESLSRNLKCSAGNSREIFYHWDVTSLTLKDVQCGISYLGNIIYHFGSDCWLFFLHFVHALQSSLVMSIIITFYYLVVALLACDIFYTTIMKPRFQPEERQRINVFDNEIEDAGSSNTSSTISIHMLFELNSTMNSALKLDKDSSLSVVESLSNFYASHSNAVWEAENCDQRLKSYSFSAFEGRNEPGLRRFVRLCKSLSSLRIDGVSRGSSLVSDALNISSFDLATHSSSTTSSFKSVYSSRSSLNMLALSQGSHDGGQKELTELHSLNSTALSQYSQHTMYKYPVPASVTSSDPHQHQLKRSEREYVFVQRPFVTPLPLVNSWLQNNFFGSRASNRASPVSDPGIFANQAFSVGQDSQDGQSGSWVPSTPRDPCYLINNQKTEVVLCGIPGDTTQDYFRPMVEMVRSRTWGSMIELHHKPKWTPSTARIRSVEMCKHTSLPNICEEFGLKNRIAFNVQVLESFTSMSSYPHHHQNSSIEEKDDTFDDNFDSISVVLQKVEKRDQALRDAARARMEQNRERQARRLRLFREHEETEATRPVQVTRSSFIDVLKKETYKQVFVPLLFHVVKEIVLSAALSTISLPTCQCPFDKIVMSKIR